MTEVEIAALSALASGCHLVLELGSYIGRSTVVLAGSARHVVAIDHHRGSAEHQPGATHHDARFVDPASGFFTTYPAFVAGLRRAGVEWRVTVVVGRSDVARIFRPAIFDMAFIDAGHDFASVMNDAILARELVKPGGHIVFHDFGDPGYPGVTMAALKIAKDQVVAQPAGSLGVVMA